MKPELIAILEVVQEDLLPEDHPLIVTDRNSSQWEKCLIDYYRERNIGNVNHPLLKGVMVISIS